MSNVNSRHTRAHDAVFSHPTTTRPAAPAGTRPEPVPQPVFRTPGR